jgi:replicative DNA helicase
VVLAAELEQRGTLQRAGGAPYLHTLFGTHFATTNAAYYAGQIIERHKVRTVGALGQQFQQLAEIGAAGGDVDEMLDRARGALEKLADAASGARREFDQEVDAWLTNLGTPRARPVPTGIAELDELLGGGFRPGQLVVLGARPGVGKSVGGLGFAAAAAERGYGAAVCSMEMTKDELMERLFAREADIPLSRLRAPEMLDAGDQRRLERAADRVATWPLLIADEGEQTLASIGAVARSRSRTPRGLRLLAVDYIQLMTATTRTQKRHEVVGEFSRGLKLLAKKLGITVVALAQLNRQSDQRTDKRPHLSDLRESGSLEQDADIVMLLHRDPDDPEGMDRVEVWIPKHRGGPTGKLDLFWSGPYQRITGRTPFEPLGDRAHLRAVQ